MPLPVVKKGAQKRAELAAMRRERLAKRLAQQENIEDMLRSDESGSEADDLELDPSHSKSAATKAHSDSESDSASEADESGPESESEDEDEPLLELISNAPHKKAGTAGAAGAKSGKTASGADLKTTSSVMFLGHIPHGFYEVQMKSYFSQFGKIKKLRLSRNKKTGRSKHYAYIEFEDAEVAKVAAATMNGYLLYNHLLVAQVVPPEKIHADLFKGCNRRFKVLARAKMHAEKMSLSSETPKTPKKLQKDASRAKKRNMKLAELGIDYKFNKSTMLPASSAASVV